MLLGESQNGKRQGRDKTIILQDAELAERLRRTDERKEQKRSRVVVGNTGFQQGPCSGAQGAVVVLEQESPNTGWAHEGKRYKDSGRAE